MLVLALEGPPAVASGKRIVSNPMIQSSQGHQFKLFSKTVKTLSELKMRDKISV